MENWKAPYSRSRKRETPYPSSFSWAWWSVSPSGVISYTVPWTQAVGSGQTTVEIMDDVVTPAWPVIKAKGGIVNNRMSKSTTVKTGSDAGWKFRYTGSGGTINYGEGTNNCFAATNNYPGHGPIGDDFPSSISNLLVEMVTQLRAKVNASTAQLAVSLGEMRETMRLLARPTAGLGRIIESAARMRAGRGRASRNMPSFYQGLESLWLTERYGWRPVMIDIEKFLEAYGESRWKLRDRVTVKRTLSSTGPTIASSKLVVGGDFYFPCTQRTEVNSTIVMGNYHELAKHDSDDILGVRLQDMPLAAWNLLPFSFVVDWFVNVSQLLGTLASFNTTTLAEWYVVKDVTKTVKLSVGGNAQAGWVVERYPNACLVTETTTYRRLPYLPRSPGLAIREDSTRRFFQGDLRNLDALALLTASFRTGRIPIRGVR